MGHKDPEVRRRALRLVPGLEHAKLVAPKRLTLTIRNQPMRVILEEISKQTGYQIQHQGMMIGGVVAAPVVKGKGKAKAAGAPGEPTHSYAWVNEPFWDVIDRVCRDGNLVIQAGYGDAELRLYQGGAGPPAHAGRDGAFRYAATGMQLYRTIDLESGTSSRSESLHLNLALFSEPRLPLLSVGAARLDVAYDSERNSMIPKDREDGLVRGRSRRFYGSAYKRMSMHVSLSLNRVSEKATTLRLIRGVVPVTLLVEQKPVELSDDALKAKGKKVTVGDLDFHIEGVEKQGNDEYEVSLTVTNKGNPNDYSWQSGLYRRVELLDDKGVKLFNRGSSSSTGNNTSKMTLHFGRSGGAGKPGAPKRIVYQHWVTRQHDVRFELKDVPLP
jgi:hypothetical protein